MSVLRDAANALLDIAFPDSCCICGEVRGNFFKKELPYVNTEDGKLESPFCESCTRSLMSASGMWEINPPPTKADRALYLFDYNYETVQRAILHIKVKECASCIEFFAKFIGPIIEKLSDRDDIILTYIPRSTVRKRKFGFDQSLSILQTYVRYADKEFVQLLKRTGNSPYMQKQLSPRDRIINAQNTLKTVENGILPKNIVVFDDIITTGATAEVSAKLLSDGGAEHINMLFLANRNIMTERS